MSTDKISAFLEAFEDVFNRDWNYTKEMLEIPKETDAQKAAAVDFGLEPMPIIAEGGTFLNPKVGDETEDWGNRGRLLAAYRALRIEMP